MPPDPTPPPALPQLPPHLKAVLDAALDCIVTIDVHGRVIEFNATAERTFGYTRAEALGREMSDLIIPPAMRERHRAGLRRMVETGTGAGLAGRRIEVHAMRADGTEFPVELTITKVEVGPDIFFTAYLREDLVSRLQTRFTAILDAALDCIITIDHAGRIVDFNAAATRTFGYAREQAVGREMAELIVPPALRERHRAGLMRLVETGHGAGIVGSRIEITALHAGGREFPVELAITQVDSTGKLPFFTAYLRDLTERHRAEAAQRESQTYFEKTFHSSPALMSIASAVDGKLLEVNPAFIRGAGYTREEALGRTTLELGLWLRPEQRDEFLRRIRTDRVIRDLEADFRGKTGHVRTLLLNADIMELGGRPCMLTVGIDITDRRRRDQVQAATYEISRAVLGGDDLPALLAKVHAIIAGLMPAKNCYVAMLSPDRALLSFPYFVDETMPPAPPRPVRNGITEYVIATGQPLLAGDAEIRACLMRRPGPIPSEHRSAQWMGAPLLIDGRSTGVIAVQDYQNPNAYTEEDLRLFVFVAEQTAAAIHRQQVEAAQRESRAYFEKSFNSSPALMSIARAADGAIIEANPAFLRISGYTREEVIGRTTIELNLWRDAAKRSDFINPIRATGAVRDFSTEFRTKSGASRTMILNADLIELRGEPCVLTVGVDITERQRRDQVQAATYEISQAVLGGDDLVALLGKVHRILDGLISAKNFYVALLNADRSILSFPYFVDERSPQPQPRPPRHGITEFVIETREPLLGTYAEISARISGRGTYTPSGQPSAQWLGAPLIIDGRGIGVIAVQDYHNPSAYTEEDRRLLMFVAEQTAAAIHRQQVEAAQRESRTYFEKSFHSSPALMAISRVADGSVTEVNPAFLRGYGFTREEVIGRTTTELGLWTRADQRAEIMRQMLAQGMVRNLEVDIRDKGGAIRTLIVNADIIELGGERCTLTVGIDITERRKRDRVQAAIYKISQVVLAGGDLTALFAEVHRIIAELMAARNLYVALLSADGTLLSFPYFVDEHVVSPPPRALANGFTEYLLATARPRLVRGADLPALLSAHGPYQPLDRPAAQRIGAPLLIAGRAIGVIALQDYTDPSAYGEEDLRLLTFVAEQTAAAVHRHAAGEALRNAERQYRSIFENALEGLYVSSPEGRFLSANPALARMLGFATPADLLAAFDDIQRQLYVNSARRDDFFALIQKSDEVTDFESEVYRRDGTTVWVSEAVRVVRNAAGAIDHFEGVAADVTVKREAARALQAAKEAADAASRSKSYFLASVSHELRTPLNGILGYTQILRRDTGLTDKQRDGVRVIHESADHLLALINDVLDLSKIEAGRIELHPADFDLPDFATGAERVFTPRAREKSLLFETALAADLPRFVHGDEQRLRQVVFNLMANAVKFTATGGVVFSVQPGASGTIRFSVSDTGPGISADDIQKLFEPFTQVGRNQAAASGTGLGLAISHSLVARMGGQLRVESKPGWGSRFWFEIPLPVAVSAAPAVFGSSRRVLGYEGPRRRVLIVDDNAINRSVMVDMLAPLGFNLAEAADGETSLTQTAAFQPDLILMDLRMPGGMDGLEATRRLRQTPLGRTVKIIAVSASAYDLDRSECFAAGCDAFLAKPFREEELWTVIERALGLAWRLVDGGETQTPFQISVASPPAAEADALYELAAKGDVVAIRARAQALLESDPRLAPFAQNVLDLAARFKMKAIRQFVARHGSNPPP